MEDLDQRFHFVPDSDESVIFQKLYLLGFSKDGFMSKWRDFKSKKIEELADTQIRQSIREVMTFRNPITKQSYYNIPTWTYLYNKGSKFYRVRKVASNEISIPLKETSSWEDIWNPPEHFVTEYGRLNYPLESMLYTSANNPVIAIGESKIKENDSFVLITYEAIEDIQVTIVGFHQDSNYLTKTENEKSNTLTMFFKDIFTKEVKHYQKNLYKISSNLIKECYTINDGIQDGWVYPSIANGQGHNVCFKATALGKLKVSGVELCKKESLHGFLVYYVLDDIDERSKFSYHQIGSEIQAHKYPHINTRQQ